VRPSTQLSRSLRYYLVHNLRGSERATAAGRSPAISAAIGASTPTPRRRPRPTPGSASIGSGWPRAPLGGDGARMGADGVSKGQRTLGALVTVVLMFAVARPATGQRRCNRGRGDHQLTRWRV
jgi:hypothetical protein